MARAGNRGEFEWVEEHASAAAQIADHQARAVAIVVAIDLDRGEFTTQLYGHRNIFKRNAVCRRSGETIQGRR